MYYFSEGDLPSSSSNAEKVTPDQQKFEPCFFARSPETVRYAASVEDLKNNKIIVIPRDAFAAQHGFDWKDSMLVEPNMRDLLWTDSRFPKKAWTLLEERLHNPLDCFVVVKINDDIGHAVFYLPQDGKPLPAGTLIGIYAASLVDGTTNITFAAKPDVFSIGLNEDDHQASIINRSFTTVRASAKKFGNITRFMLDAPSEETLKKIPADPLIKSNIITQNVAVYPFIYNGVPVQLMFLVRDTLPYEQLVWPYDGEKEDLHAYDSFWNVHNIRRCLFNREGKVIGYLNDDTLRIYPFYLASSVLAAPRPTFEDGMKHQPIGKSMTTDINNYNYKKRFYENIRLALTVFSNRFPESTETGKIIAALKKALHDNRYSMDRAYTALRMIFVDAEKDATYEKIKPQLEPLRKEVSFNMIMFVESRKNKLNVEEPFIQVSSTPTVAFKP